MEFFFRSMNGDDCSLTSKCPFADQGIIQRCPFLRNNINHEPPPTDDVVAFSSPTATTVSCFSLPAVPGVAKGPIFEVGPSFDMAFKLFHGQDDGVVPLLGKSTMCRQPDKYLFEVLDHPPTLTHQLFNPLPITKAAATISLSAFGLGGPFSFDSFTRKWNKKSKSSSKNKEHSSSHEAVGNEWLENGNCPIAKSYRAVSRVLPLVAKALRPPPGMKFKCPPAVVAARAALARTALVKAVRPQTLPTKMLVIGLLGMAANVPLGVWKEHTKKFSISWFAAVHAAVPFIAMLRKSVLMPKTAMAFTIAASVLGQVIGSRAERIHMNRMKAVATKNAELESSSCNPTSHFLPTNGIKDRLRGEIVLWDSLVLKGTSTGNVCY